MTESDLVHRIQQLARDQDRSTSNGRNLTGLLMRPQAHAVRPPVPPAAVAEAQRRLGFSLPAILVRLWTEVANGGFGPGGGIFPIDNQAAFTFGLPIPNCYLQLSADRSVQWPEKLLLLTDWGCAVYSAIDCATADGEVVTMLSETEWRRTGQTFARWMEDWACGVDLWARDIEPLRPRSRRTRNERNFR